MSGKHKFQESSVNGGVIRSCDCLDPRAECEGGCTPEDFYIAQIAAIKERLSFLESMVDPLRREDEH